MTEITVRLRSYCRLIACNVSFSETKLFVSYSSIFKERPQNPTEKKLLFCFFSSKGNKPGKIIVKFFWSLIAARLNEGLCGVHLAHTPKDCWSLWTWGECTQKKAALNPGADLQPQEKRGAPTPLSGWPCLPAACLQGLLLGGHPRGSGCRGGCPLIGISPG